MFWLDNPYILFNNENYTQFVPTNQMTLIEKMNAITRFCIYGIFIGNVLDFDDNIIHLLFSIIILIVIIYKLNQNKVNSFNNNNINNNINNNNINNNNNISNNNQLSSDNINKLSEDLSKLIVKNPTLLQNFNLKSEDKITIDIPTDTKNETEYSNNNQINEQCTPPTKDNPLMNRNLYDNPLKNPACEYDNKTSELVNEKFGYNLYQDIDDMFERYNSQRQFYTTPNTNLPNNQSEFAKWLYETEPTCKESGVNCVRYEDIRTKRNSD